MPELPEVESIRLQLERYLVGHMIQSIEVKNRKIFQGDEKKLEGAKVIKVRRFGKVLVMDLDNGNSIVSHIKLTGQFLYRGPNLKQIPTLSKKVVGGVPGNHTHVIFHLDKHGFLYYNDVRQFGWIKIAQSSRLRTQNEFLAKLGPEPLDGLTLEIFKSLLSKTKRAIKVLIMDQSKMGGVGNIYANDALYDAQIDPKRPASSLSGDEAEVLYKSIEKVLKKGLETGGASELAFVTPDGQEGKYQNYTLVYGKEGTKCKHCGTTIEKYTLGGRGTYWCPHCQA